MTQYMDIGEFRRLGLLQEANRRFFHPIGLALAVNGAKDGEEPILETLSGIFDSRDDPEGFVFTKLDVNEATERAVYYSKEVNARLDARTRLFTSQHGPRVVVARNGWQPLTTVGRAF